MGVVEGTAVGGRVRGTRGRKEGLILGMDVGIAVEVGNNVDDTVGSLEEEGMDVTIVLDGAEVGPSVDAVAIEEDDGLDDEVGVFVVLSIKSKVAIEILRRMEVFKGICIPILSFFINCCFCCFIFGDNNNGDVDVLTYKFVIKAILII